MKISLTSLLFLVLLLSPGKTSSQSSIELKTVGENIINFIQWKYESVPPITISADLIVQPTTDVILQQWNFEDQSVRIAVVSHGSVGDAVEEMQNLAARGERGLFQELGDEDVTWGRGTVSFRKRNLTVNVSAVITKPTVDVSEAGKHDPDERKLSKEFARLVAKAIKDK
jgi:hypothetical protein